MSVFCKRLRDTRAARMLTQDELAERADISRVMVSRYETGAVIPTVDVLIRIADALNISIDYLLGREDQVFPSSPQKSDVPTNTEQNDLPQNRDELRDFILSVLKERIFPDS